jgi:hypothetical protein
MPPSNPMRGSGGSTRVTPLWLLALAAILFAARITSGVWAEIYPESRPELARWTAPAAAAEEARSSHRLVLYVFLDRKQADSRQLAADLFADVERAGRLNGEFVLVQIDGPAAEDTPETAALRAQYEVRDLPALVVTTVDGSRSKRIAGNQNVREIDQQLTAARFELLDRPGVRRRGMQFQFGTGPRGSADTLGAGDDSLRTSE